jgi:ABC-type sugar transport system permease subunit
MKFLHWPLFKKGKASKKEGGHEKNDLGIALLFSAPWLLGFFVFSVYPLIQSFLFSFNNVTVTTTGIVQKSLGWDNFLAVLTADPDFITDLESYLQEMLIYVPVIIVVSLVLALLLNSLRHGKGFFRTIFFLPVIISSGPVISLFISQGVASFPGASTLNYTLLAESVPDFLVGLLKTLITSFIMILWLSGIQTLIFLAGLQKLDRSMYEAAKIDGASGWECFWKITLPALNPVIVINVIFTVVFQSTFSLNPIIAKIASDMFAVGKGYGYACAEAWVYFLVLLLVLGFFLLIFRSKKHRRSYQQE